MVITVRVQSLVDDVKQTVVKYYPWKSNERLGWTVISLQLCKLNHSPIFKSYVLSAAWHIKDAYRLYYSHKAARTCLTNVDGICLVSTVAIAYESLLQSVFLSRISDNFSVAHIRH